MRGFHVCVCAYVRSEPSKLLKLMSIANIPDSHTYFSVCKYIL